MAGLRVKVVVVYCLLYRAARRQAIVANNIRLLPEFIKKRFGIVVFLRQAKTALA
jgi:hypothetical protein